MSTHFSAFMANKDHNTMAKSLSSILTQIERLQREAAAIQSGVIDRIKKDIAKYGLTVDQLFGQPETRPARSVKKATKAKVVRSPKYADDTGNTWGGMGKRPVWLRQALDAGKSLEDFLVSGSKPKVASAPTSPKPARTSKRKAAAGAAPSAKKRPLAKRAARKPRPSVAAPAAD